MGLAYLDIDTQIDFMFAAGALYVPGAEKLLPVVLRLNQFAVSQGIALVSTACAHAEDDPEFREWPPHCIVGTVGQQKPAALLAGQPVFEKQSTDMFDSRAAEDLIRSLDASEFIVYGVVTEVCVHAAALGLLARGKRVTVVEDAVRALDNVRATAFWIELQARGGRRMQSEQVLHLS